MKHADRLEADFKSGAKSNVGQQGVGGRVKQWDASANASP